MTMTIKRKLFGGFAAVLALVAVVSLVAIGLLWDSHDRLDRMTGVTAEKIKIAGEASSRLLEINRAKNNILLSSSAEEIQDYAADIERLKVPLYRRIQQLYALAQPELKAQLDETRLRLEQYFDVSARLTALARAGQTQEARTLSVEQARNSLEAAYELIAGILEKSSEEMTADGAESHTDFHNARALLVSCVAVAVGLGFLAAGLIVRGIVARVDGLSEKAARIAAGKTSEQNEEKGHDELSPLSLALDEISRSFANITRQAQRITGGIFPRASSSAATRTNSPRRCGR